MKVYTNTVDELVNIELNYTSAKILSAVLSGIGGTPDTSPRGEMQDLLNQLITNGFNCDNEFRSLLSGMLYFENYNFILKPPQLSDVDGDF